MVSNHWLKIFRKPISFDLLSDDKGEERGGKEAGRTHIATLSSHTSPHRLLTTCYTSSDDTRRPSNCSMFEASIWRVPLKVSSRNLLDSIQEVRYPLDTIQTLNSIQWIRWLRNVAKSRCLKRFPVRVFSNEIAFWIIQIEFSNVNLLE